MWLKWEESQLNCQWLFLKCGLGLNLEVVGVLQAIVIPSQGYCGSTHANMSRNSRLFFNSKFVCLFRFQVIVKTTGDDKNSLFNQYPANIKIEACNSKHALLTLK